MTTLLMGDEWKADERRVWMRTHKLLSNALEIGDRKDCTIFLRKGERVREGQRAWVSKFSPKEFCVTAFDADPISMIAAYAHEKVHVKQYLKGELQEAGRNYSIWKGEKIRNFNPPCRNAFEEMLYKEQPWEKEAFARMEPLAQAAITALPREDQAWLKSHYQVMEDA